MTIMIEIQNDGTRIRSTNYWSTEHAMAGLCYLSGNAGDWRLLVPAAAAGMLPEMRTGVRISIEPSLQTSECWDIVFEDGSDSPFALALDKRQVDRAMTPGRCRLTVWTPDGLALDLPCDVRTS